MIYIYSFIYMYLIYNLMLNDILCLYMDKCLKNTFYND